MLTARDVYQGLDLSLRIGELLLSAGAGASDVATTMLAVGNALGLRACEVDVTFTSLTMSCQYADDDVPTTQIRRVVDRVPNYYQLTQVDHLIGDIEAGRIEVREARQQLAQIVSGARPWSRNSATLGWGFMAMGAGALMGGDPIVMIVAFLAAVTVDLAGRLRWWRRLPEFYQRVLGGFIVTAFAVASTPFHVASALVVTASIIVLLSGIALVGALQDAVTGYYVTSAARGLEAVLLTGGLLAGISGGFALANRLGINIRLEGLSIGSSGVWVLLLGAAVTAAAFAFASYAPLRSLLPIAGTACVGTAIFKVLLDLDFGRPFATGPAALSIGFVGYFVARRFHVPPLVVVVTCISPLLPGMVIYSALLSLNSGEVNGFLDLFTAASVAIALASGVILGEYVAQPLASRARRWGTRLQSPRIAVPRSVSRMEKGPRLIGAGHDHERDKEPRRWIRST